MFEQLPSLWQREKPTAQQALFVQRLMAVAGGLGGVAMFISLVQKHWK